MSGLESNTRWSTPAALWIKLKPVARQMRRQPTPSESQLWHRLRDRKLGYRFRRQHPIGRFIVDFYCAQAQLVVEVDGPVHEYTPEEDAVRQEFLEAQGLRVLRFTNEEVSASLDNVVKRIIEAI